MPASLQAFEGRWAGTGTLSHQNGVTERIRCQVDYVSSGSQTLRQILQCQSDTTNFDLVSSVTETGGRLTGDWTETNRQAHGSLTGTVGNGEIRAEVRGPSFAANVGIAVRGNRQSIAIRAAGTDITSVNMALTRTSR